MAAAAAAAGCQAAPHHRSLLSLRLECRVLSNRRWRSAAAIGEGGAFANGASPSRVCGCAQRSVTLTRAAIQLLQERQRPLANPTKLG